MAAKQVLCFGELLLRLDSPGRELLLQSGRFDVHVGGAEANVAVALARLDHPSAMISVVPDNALGIGALSAIRAHGVDCGGVVRRPGRMGLYFLAKGAGARASEIIYDRADSAFAQMPPNLFDWPELLRGAARLHISGITPALGPPAAQATLDAVSAAKAAGVPVSFDCNFRAKLWDRWNDSPRATLTPLVAAADVLFANHRDFTLLLQRNLKGETPEDRRRAAEAAFDAFPQLKYIASTSRTVETSDRHYLAARIDTPDQGYETEKILVDGIVDRIGAGDAFAAAILHSLSSGGDLTSLATSGLALCCLKHTLPGDASLFSLADLRAFQCSGSDVRR